jgi:hypothetical protein
LQRSQKVLKGFANRWSHAPINLCSGQIGLKLPVQKINDCSVMGNKSLAHKVKNTSPKLLGNSYSVAFDCRIVTFVGCIKRKRHEFRSFQSITFRFSFGQKVRLIGRKELAECRQLVPFFFCNGNTEDTRQRMACVVQKERFHVCNQRCNGKREKGYGFEIDFF